MSTSWFGVGLGVRVICLADQCGNVIHEALSCICVGDSLVAATFWIDVCFDGAGGKSSMRGSASGGPRTFVLTRPGARVLLGGVAA